MNWSVDDGKWTVGVYFTFHINHKKLAHHAAVFVF